VNGIWRAILTGVLFGAFPGPARASDPIVQTRFTADPAPLVHDGVVYLYTSHDEDDAAGFKMLDWRLYTSTDMVNWTDRGAVASLKTFPWAVQSNDAWAPQVIERGGKFYLYVPISVAGSPKNVIAVAVADNPAGPFRDALGHPLIGPARDNIDPTVAVDDDGQAYLYWGNPDLWYVRLNRDMISYSGKIEKIGPRISDYQEGPWFYKRQGKYYMAFASTCCSEGIGYAVSDRATGPWTYKGPIMDHNPAATGNHPGIIDYKGGSYVFGFSYELNFAMTPIHHERRSVTVAKFDYHPDGTIPNLGWWDRTTAPQIETLNPYDVVQAELQVVGAHCIAYTYLLVIGSAEAMTVDDDTPIPGEVITISAGGFATESPIEISIDRYPIQGECYPRACRFIGVGSADAVGRDGNTRDGRGDVAGAARVGDDAPAAS